MVLVLFSVADREVFFKLKLLMLGLGSLKALLLGCFVGYTNDLLNCVSSEVRLFTDDLIFHRQVDFSSNCSSLQDDTGRRSALCSLW